LADRAQVTRQCIAAIEKGKRLPSLYLAFKLAYALDTDVLQIFKLTDDELDKLMIINGRPDKGARNVPYYETSMIEMLR